MTIMEAEAEIARLRALLREREEKIIFLSAQIRRVHQSRRG